MIDGENFFDQLVKINFRTYDNIRNIVTGQGDDYATGYFQDYPYLVAIDLSKKRIRFWYKSNIAN